MTRGHRGSLVLRCGALSSPSPRRFIPAHPLFSPPPSERSEPPTPGGPSGLQSRLSTPSMAFAVTVAARLLLIPTHRWDGLTTRQASLHATDRSVAPPTGLSTLGFDPSRYRTEPPACYRASWQLPRRDSHPLATTSLCWISSPQSTTSNSGHTLLRPQTGGGPAIAWWPKESRTSSALPVI